MNEQEQYDYSLKELFEEAKNDASWEADEQMREELTSELYGIVNRA
jgi:hypothetical protein